MFYQIGASHFFIFLLLGMKLPVDLLYYQHSDCYKAIFANGVIVHVDPSGWDYTSVGAWDSGVYAEHEEFAMWLFNRMNCDPYEVLSTVNEMIRDQ